MKSNKKNKTMYENKYWNKEFILALGGKNCLCEIFKLGNLIMWCMYVGLECVNYSHIFVSIEYLLGIQDNKV